MILDLQNPVKVQKMVILHSPASGIGLVFIGFKDLGKRGAKSSVPTCIRHYPPGKQILHSVVVGTIKVINLAASNFERSIKMSLENSDLSRTQF